jgi:hypothetical protein
MNFGVNKNIIATVSVGFIWTKMDRKKKVFAPAFILIEILKSSCAAETCFQNTFQNIESGNEKRFSEQGGVSIVPNLSYSYVHQDPLKALLLCELQGRY